MEMEMVRVCMIMIEYLYFFNDRCRLTSKEQPSTLTHH